MANYYSFNATGSNQNYGVSNPGTFGSSSYGVAQSQQPGTFIAPTHQVQQPQTAYVTYGHQSASSSASSQSYQPSYNNFPSSTPQQPTYSKSVSQTQHYYPQGSSNTSAGGTTAFYSNNQNDVIKTEPVQQNQIYGGSAGGGYNQPLTQVKQVSIPQSSRVQPSSQLGYIAPKPVTATVISSGPTAKPNSGGYSQQSISNYEKALINAATSMYQQQRKGGGGAANQANNRNLPYWKQKRLQAQQNRDPNKPIVASEVKAYLYAWLGKERTRPEYNITAQGNSPFRQTYVCEVVAPGFQYVAKGAASNKKDAQTRAAWDFCDFLVKEGKMKEEELPTRENKFKAANNKLPASYKEKDQKQVTEVIAKKKLATKKINFVGGTPLTLQTGPSQSTAASTPVAYPTVTVDSTPKVGSGADPVIKTVSVASVPTTIVKVKQEAASVPKALSANDVDVSASKNNPIGESYVEQVWTDGRVIRYRCKLCECEFNDPSARELHVRGRRHRMSYKKKVDPSIEVDVKLNPKQRNLMMMKMRQEARKDAMRQQQKERQMWKAEMRKQEEAEMRLFEEEIWCQYQEDLRLYEEEMEFHRRRKIPPPTHLFPPQPPMLKYFQPHAQVRSQQMKTLDDQHVLAKHALIYPSEEELAVVQKSVQHVEGALKEVSSAIHEQELKVYTASLTGNTKKPQPVRLLKAVLRIGALAKGLLLRGDLSVELVLMCNEKPTVGMITRVADNLFKNISKGESGLKFSMKISVEESAINLVTASQPSVTIKVILTSTSMRPSDEAKAVATKGGSKPDPPDILDRQKCSLALAALRHAKWFQAKANGLQSCVIVTRIMKDLCVRVPTWTPLSDWAVELIVERVISSAKLPMSPSAALQRVFEAIASGVLLPGGPGILDPCEREPTDAAGSLTSQEREDITSSAQHALRLITFRNIHKVLGIDSISTSGSRKRPNDEENDSKSEVPETASKKGKLEA